MKSKLDFAWPGWKGTCNTCVVTGSSTTLSGVSHVISVLSFFIYIFSLPCICFHFCVIIPTSSTVFQTFFNSISIFLISVNSCLLLFFFPCLYSLYISLFYILNHSLPYSLSSFFFIICYINCFLSVLISTSLSFYLFLFYYVFSILL